MLLGAGGGIYLSFGNKNSMAFVDCGQEGGIQTWSHICIGVLFWEEVSYFGYCPDVIEMRTFQKCAEPQLHPGIEIHCYACVLSGNISVEISSSPLFFYYP